MAVNSGPHEANLAFEELQTVPWNWCTLLTHAATTTTAAKTKRNNSKHTHTHTQSKAKQSKAAKQQQQQQKKKKRKERKGIQVISSCVFCLLFFLFFFSPCIQFAFFSNIIWSSLGVQFMGMVFVDLFILCRCSLGNEVPLWNCNDSEGAERITSDTYMYFTVTMCTDASGIFFFFYFTSPQSSRFCVNNKKNAFISYKNGRGKTLAAGKNLSWCIYVVHAFGAPNWDVI